MMPVAPNSIRHLLTLLGLCLIILCKFATGHSFVPLHRSGGILDRPPDLTPATANALSGTYVHYLSITGVLYSHGRLVLVPKERAGEN